MELLNQLINNLGVNEDQAKGGAGLIFKMVKEKLGSDDFNKLAESVPDADNLINAAPEEGGLAGTLGGLTSGLGGSLGNIGGLASLAGGFSKLGLDSDMVGKFIPVILSFVQSKGGDSLKDMLQNILD